MTNKSTHHSISKYPESTSISLGSLSISDFNIPTLAFLALFTYWYIFPQHFFPIIFSLKIPTFGVAICILAAIFQFSFMKYSHVKTELTALVILGLLFILSKLYVNNIETASFYTQEHFHALFVGMAFYANFNSTKKLHLFVVTLIIYGTFSGLIGFREGGLIWTHDFLKDENQLSTFMAMVLPVTLFYSFYTDKLYKKLLCYLCAGIQVALIIQSFSRGGFLALVIVGLLTFLNTKRKFFVFFMMLVAIVLILNVAPQRFFEEVKSLQQGTEEATAHSRMRFWGRAWRMFLDKPIIGHGIGQYPAENARYRLPGVENKVTDRLVCHSNWFQVLSELGIIGLSCYLVIWLKYFETWRLVNKKNTNRGPPSSMSEDEVSFYKNISTGFAIGMIGFIVAGTFINILIFAYYYNFVFFMMTLKATWLSKQDLVNR